MAKKKSGSGSPSKAAAAAEGKSKSRKGSRKKQGTGPNFDAAAAAGSDASSAAGAGESPPTTASELKALLKQSLEQELHEGVANASLNAASEAPLLLRADTATPRASPDKTSSSHKKKKKTKKTAEEQKSLERPSTHHRQSLSAASTPRDSDKAATNTNDNREDEPNDHLSDGRVHRSRNTWCSFGSWCVGSSRSSSSTPWGVGRLLLALGTLRVLQSDQQQTLSRTAQSQLQALAPLAKKCWIELFVKRSDELPFGAYSKPQVRVHLVDRFTGRAMQPTQTTSPAKLNYSHHYTSASRPCQASRSTSLSLSPPATD